MTQNPNPSATFLCERSLSLLLLLAFPALFIACGGGGGGKTDPPECEEHADCADHEICDPATETCIPNTCGDGVVRQGEVCDDGAENSDTEPDACRTTCQPARCGDGVVDTGETCDATAANGVSPSPCRSDCQLTTCGDGYLGGNEVCDSTDFTGATCSSLAGLTSGALTCAEDCLSIHTGDCFTCGDGEIDGPEVCDGDNVGTSTCVSLGHDGGELACASSCFALDPSGCWTCGDGLCQHATGESSQSCPQDCGWVKITSASTFGCGIKGDGTVWCWGSNTYGTLGNGTYDNSLVPVKVHGLSDVVAISAVVYHACALKGDGTLWCWGRNYEGELGDGSTVDSPIPVQALVANAISVSAGEMYTCATIDDGTLPRVACWGFNWEGRLGTGDTESSVVPLFLTTPMTEVVAYTEHTCAIRVSDQRPLCWGRNGYGQLGNGTTVSSNSPVLVDPPSSFASTSVAVGGLTTCAITHEQTVRCWGNGTYGQLGNSTFTTSVTTSVPVLGPPAFVLQLSGAWNQFCVRVSDTNGSAYCWGGNASGVLGDGTNENRNVPTLVTGLTGVSDIAAGPSATCAVTSAGAAYCWGNNEFGHLGDGTTTTSYTPVQVIDPYGS